MDSEKYPSNSHKSKEQEAKVQERPKVESVVKGTTMTRKKTLGTKIRDTFIAEDLVKVKDYVISDVIIPNIKKAVDDIVSNGIHMVLYGSAGRPANSSRTAPISQRVSYRSYYDQRNGSVPVRVANNGYDFEDVVFDSRGDAELVLDQMIDIISSYGVCTVADYYDSCGRTSDYTTVDYGWRNLRSARVDRVSEGYVIKLPRAVPIR